MDQVLDAYSRKTGSVCGCSTRHGELLQWNCAAAEHTDGGRTEDEGAYRPLNDQVPV